MFSASFEVLDLGRNGDPSETYGRQLRRLVAAAGADHGPSDFEVPSGPAAHDLPNGRLLLVVPVADDEGSQVIAGVISGRSADLALRLAASAFDLVLYWEEVAELHSQLDEFAVQVSADFEELAWLRELAGYLEICDVGNALEEVAAAALPRLREVIGAEVVALVAADGTGPSVCPQGCLFRDGARGPADGEIEALVRRLGSAPLSRPVVKNRLDRDTAFSGVSGVSSCVVVPLARQGRVYGWLVAVNRLHPTCGTDGVSRLGDDEFGTVEAGLVNSAAVMLATHARNSELFRERHAAG
jgi:hypothetical protein